MQGGDQFFKRTAGTLTKDVGVLPTATPLVKNMIGLGMVPDALAQPIFSQVAGMVTGHK